MQPRKGIFWLASYPKSGNTWFRIVLANALSQSNTPVHINHINTGVSAAVRGLMNRALGFDSSLLSHDELEQLRPSIYQWYGENTDRQLYFKTHDAYSHVSEDVPLIPSTGCLGALYFLRNPLDVVISFAHHFNCSIDRAIEMMGCKKFVMYYGQHRPTPQLRQYFLSWSHHVQSWLSTSDIPVLPLRYEDMSCSPHETFRKAFDFLKLDISTNKLQQALEHADIKKLQQQEKQCGFSEGSPMQQSHFFRKGRVDDWKNTLSKLQIKHIIEDHGDMMEAHGYLNRNC